MYCKTDELHLNMVDADVERIKGKNDLLVNDVIIVVAVDVVVVRLR